MKKISKFLISASLLMMTAGATQALAYAKWVGKSAIYVNATWYYGDEPLDWCSGGQFNGADLGNITSLQLGGQSQVYDENGANWGQGTMKMYYSIDGATAVEHTLTYYEFADNNNKFQSGGSNFAPETIDFTDLRAGKHTLAVWFNSDNKWDSNNDNNYVASFTTGYAISSEPSGTGSVSVEQYGSVVSYAYPGSPITITVETKAPYHVEGVNIDGYEGLDSETFTEESDTRWTATIDMPNNDITIRPIFCKPYHGVQAISTNAYTIAYSPQVAGLDGKVEVGETVYLNVTPSDGYVIEGVKVVALGMNIEEVALTEGEAGSYTFVMPDADVQVQVDYYKEGGTYALNIDAPEGTSVTCMNENHEPIKNADEGQTVALLASSGTTTVTDQVPVVRVTDADGNTVATTQVQAGLYQFTMPGKDITVHVTFSYAIYNRTHSGPYSSAGGTCIITVDGAEVTTADAGVTVNCAVTLEEGFSLFGFKVYYNSSVGEEVAVTQTGDLNYSFTMPASSVVVSPEFGMELADAADNSAALSALDELNNQISVKLKGRTFYKDGSWNTLCLPFDTYYDVPQHEGTLSSIFMSPSELDGATVMTLDAETSGFDSGTGVLTLNFTEVTVEDEEEEPKQLESGVPYIVKWTSGSDVTDPVFSSVYVDSTEPGDVATSDGTTSFLGTFSPKELHANTSANLYLGADNKLYYPTEEGFVVGAFRAYFLIELGESEASQGIRAFHLNFGDETTEIVNLSRDGSSEGEGGWFTLDGRRVMGVPSVRGLYVSAGRKVLVK